MHGINPYRLLIKAILLAGIANIGFALLNPPIGSLTLYNFLFPGRERFSFEDAGDEKLGNSIMLFEDLDALFSSHVASKSIHSTDEYRVVLLGDSSVWGYNLPASETLSSMLNTLGLTGCAHKKIVVYNFAYVSAYLPKDLLILDHAIKYKPDLILWMVTLDAFTNGDRSTILETLSPHADEALSLIKKYNLKIDTLGFARPSFWDQTIWARRSIIKKLVWFQLEGLPWSATGVDYYIQPASELSPDATVDPDHEDRYTHRLLPSDLSFDVLSAGYDIASPTPILVVNEPIFIASGLNSGVRYNSYYPRKAYDQYRDYLSTWMNENNHPYLDLWNLVPPSDFRNTPLHYSSDGERIVSNRLAPEIMKFACQN